MANGGSCCPESCPKSSDVKDSNEAIVVPNPHHTSRSTGCRGIDPFGLGERSWAQREKRQRMLRLIYESGDGR